MQVGDRLRLDALGRIDHQDRALASCERTRNFVGEIHMARRVEQVEFVSFSVLRLVLHRHRMGLDGDALLAFEIHRIEQLILLFTLGDRARRLQEAIGKRGLAVIDVGDDRKITGQLGGHGGKMNAAARGERMQESADMARKIRAAAASSVMQQAPAICGPACKILAMRRIFGSFPVWTNGSPAMHALPIWRK